MPEDEQGEAVQDPQGGQWVNTDLDVSYPFFCPAVCWCKMPPLSLAEQHNPYGISLKTEMEA